MWQWLSSLLTLRDLPVGRENIACSMLPRAGNCKTGTAPAPWSSLGKLDSSRKDTFHIPHSVGWVAEGRFTGIFMAWHPSGPRQCVIFNSIADLNLFVSVLCIPIPFVLCSVMELEAVGAFNRVCSSPEDSLIGTAASKEMVLRSWSTLQPQKNTERWKLTQNLNWHWMLGESSDWVCLLKKQPWKKESGQIPTLSAGHL